MQQYVPMIGMLGDLFFRGKDNPKAALSVREITKVVEQLGKMPADTSGQIEFAGQTIDSFQMIHESYKPLGHLNYGPIATFASLLVNATVSYAGDVTGASQLIKQMKAGTVTQDEIIGVILSIDPSIEHVAHSEVVDVVSHVTGNMPWMARKGLGLVDQFIAGMMGEPEAALPPSEDHSATAGQIQDLEDDESGKDTITKTRISGYM